MAGSIQPLPADVIARIAAGEVIDSLAAAVRELAENALDAGATRIAVSLWPQQWWVRVADNGSGMALADLRTCARAHSTSKIGERADLARIASLGFRGEALHSLAQLARLEILSRQGDAQGWHVTYNREGAEGGVEAAAIAPGTIVTVDDLFGNWPVRRRGLPGFAQQLKSVQATIQQLALCHPHINWQVHHNDRLWFRISAGQSARDILPQVLPRVRAEDLQRACREVTTPQAGPEPPESPSWLEVVLGLPDRCHRRRADWVRVAANGRFVRVPELEQIIIHSTHKALPRDRYPVCWLHLRTCPSQIDWNRHPAKTEVYLRSLAYWQEQASEAIEQALQLDPESVPNAVRNRRATALLQASEARGSYRTSDGQASAAAGSGNALQLQAIAQLRQTYILAEHASGIWLLEQHIVHERILYEQLVDDWRLVALDSPIVLSELGAAQREQLQRLGVAVEPFGERLWAVRSVPAALHQRSDCADALLELSRGADLEEAQVATACRTAIRNGTPLSQATMQQLLDRWQRTRNPNTCPHGRPIYLPLEESSLARFFRRHWVIGKSHGI